MGNTIRGDDGVGIYIARRLKQQIDSVGIDITETHEAGLNLLELITGYEKTIIIDSVRSNKGKPGSVYRFLKEDFKKKTRPFSSHQFGLAALFDFAESAGIDIPNDIIIYGIEIENDNCFSEKVTDKVKKTIPNITRQIKKEVVNGSSNIRRCWS